MKLASLNPTFYDAKTSSGDRKGVGLIFDCPCPQKCGELVSVPFANPFDGEPSIAADRAGQRGGWQRDGDTFETLTLSPSIRRVGGCGWRGWVKAGEVITV